MFGINDMTKDHWETIRAALVQYEELVYRKMTNTEKKLSDIEKTAWGEERTRITECEQAIPKLYEFFRPKD